MLLSTHHPQEASLTPFTPFIAYQHPVQNSQNLPDSSFPTCLSPLVPSCSLPPAFLSVLLEVRKGWLLRQQDKELFCVQRLVEAGEIVHLRTSNITLKMNSNIITLSSISCKAYALSYIRSFLQGTAILTFLEEIPRFK